METALLEVLTPKARQTRAHILATALDLFAVKGYQGTTMREIAAAAGCSLGLTYRYFAAKEELVIELYERCARELEEEVAALPPGPVATRTIQAMRADIARLKPYRDGFSALFGVGLSPNSETAVLGDRSAPIRDRVWRIFLRVAQEASDAPRGKMAHDLATIFYAAHLLTILFWLQDRTPDQRATQELLDFAGQMLGRLRPLLNIPFAGRALSRFAKIISPLFGPPPGTINSKASAADAPRAKASTSAHQQEHRTTP